jgi:hypothetical protein
MVAARSAGAAAGAVALVLVPFALGLLTARWLGGQS